MSLRLSLLSAAAVTALFAQQAAQADGYKYSACTSELFGGLHCAANDNNRSRASGGIHDNDHDHGGKKDNGKDKGRDGSKGDGDGNGSGGGDGGHGGDNGGGGEGGEGGGNS